MRVFNCDSCGQLIFFDNSHDLYPFVLTAPVIRKMAFVDHLVHHQ
jgi:hypothetical protein